MAEVRLEDIKPNSYKSKETPVKEAPKATPIVNKSAIVSTKKPLGQRFKDAFIAEDIADVRSWLIQDVLIPGAKNTILDMLSMVFFSKSGGRSASSYSFYRPKGYGYSGASYAPYYQSQYNGQAHSGIQRQDRSYVSHNAKVDYREVVLERRDDAQRVVDEMRGRIMEFGQVSIAEMLDFMEITSSYVDNNWGWTNPNCIGIKRMANGWLIDVAEAEPLER